MRGFRHAAWKEKLLRFQVCCRHPGSNRIARRFRDLELNRPLGFLLQHDCAGSDPTAVDDILDAQGYKVTPAQLAVDGKVEQGEFAGSMRKL